MPFSLRDTVPSTRPCTVQVPSGGSAGACSACAQSVSPRENSAPHSASRHTGRKQRSSHAAASRETGKSHSHGA